MATDLDALRSGRPHCPSDLRLDRLVADELPAVEADETRKHVATCAVCARRVAEARAGFAAFDEVDPRALLASIRARGEARTSSRPWARWLAVLVPVAAVSAAVVLTFGHRPLAAVDSAPLSPGETLAPGQTRAKGGLALHVYRSVAEHAEEVVSGAVLPSGERLRFVVDLPEAGRVMIVGVEASGSLYAAWPLASEVASLPAGPQQALPGAIALDATPGRETLYLVHCAGLREAPTCVTSGPRTPPRCPAGCRLTPFVIEKSK